MTNGFSITASRVGETASTIQYQLTVVDPSTSFLGPARYDWELADRTGGLTRRVGSVVNVTFKKDEPYTIRIQRTRNGVVDTLELNERANDLDRSGGQAFVLNLVP